MSTEIGNEERRQFTLDGNGGTASVSPYAQVVFGPRDEDRRTFDRTELIEAFASELDVILIPRADLPRVVEYDDTIRTTWRSALKNHTPSRLREEALSLLALAEYLEAHPPVDEAEVEALAEALYTADDTRAMLWDFAGPAVKASHRDLARRLVAAGWKR